MPLDKYQFQFLAESGDYLYANGSSVLPSVTPVNIGSLVDWNKLQVQWKRHSKYLGVFRKYMPDTVRFAKDAATILRNVFNTQGGSEAELSLVINKLDTTSQTYLPFFTVAVDFSKYSSEFWYVDVALMEGGITKLLNAYDTTNYSLQIGEPQRAGAEPPDPDGPTGPPKDIYMNGIPFIETYNYEPAMSYIKPGGVGAPFQYWYTYPAELTSLLGLTYINQEDLFFNGADVFSAGIPQSVATNSSKATPADIFNNSMFKGKTRTDFITITGTLNFDSLGAAGANSAPDSLNIFAQLIDADGVTSLQVITLWTSPLIAPGVTINPGLVAFTATFTTPTPNAEWYIILAGNAAVNPSNMFFFYLVPNSALVTATTKITLSINCFAIPSFVAGYTGWQVFQMLVDNLLMTNRAIPGNVWPLPVNTGGASLPKGYDNLPAPPCKSDLLTISAQYWDLDPTLTFYTSGNALRNLQYPPYSGNGPQNAYINTTFADFIKDMFVTWSAGLGIENITGTDTFVIEEISHFFQAGVKIADLGSEIKNFKISPYTDYIGNNIKFGYKDQNYQDANGNWEFNKELDYSTLVMNTQHDLDYTTPYRADPYGIESERINTAGQGSTDATSDTDVFKIAAMNSDAGITAPFYPYIDPAVWPITTPLPALELQRASIPAAPSVTGGLPQIGITDGVAQLMYNVACSPGRQVQRLMKWIKSNFFGLPQPDQQLTFKKSTRPLNMTSATSGIGPGASGGVQEFRSPINITPTGGDTYFIPRVFSFTAEVPLDLDSVMATNPYGVMGLTVEDPFGTEFYLEGFVLDAGITPGTNNTYDFILLCSPNTTIPATL